MIDKIKYWWSEDRKWFCILADNGVSQATVSLTPDEASQLSAALGVAQTIVPAEYAKQFVKALRLHGHPTAADTMERVYSVSSTLCGKGE